jgi:L-lactate dehydrogenase complex protein LldE
VTVTWHSSCHALREMNVVQHAKALIGQLEERDPGGAFNARRNAAVSGALCRQTAGDFGRHGQRQGCRHPATGASTLLAGDCGCLMNITGAMAHDGVAVDGKHLAEFLWERTNGR